MRYKYVPYQYTEYQYVLLCHIPHVLLVNQSFIPMTLFFPHSPIFQSSSVIAYTQVSFTSCDAKIYILAVNSRSQSTMSARMDNDNNQLNRDIDHEEQSSDQLNI